MSFEEGAGIWGDDVAEETNVAGPSTGKGTNEESAAASVDKAASAKTSPLFDDLDAGWGSNEAHTSRVEPDETHSAENANGQENGTSASLGGDESHNETTTGTVFEDADDAFADAGGGGGDFADDGDDGDDFGDFGDFGDGAEQSAAFDDDDDMSAGATIAHTEVTTPAAPSTNSHQADWAPLILSAETESEEISSRIRQVLAAPLGNSSAYPFHDGAAAMLSKDRVRQVDGLSQVLVTEESRRAWESLASQPEIKPVDWMRSKTRRTYLIAMGVPINLDELNSSTGDAAKRLPPLTLNYDSKASSALATGAQGGESHDSASSLHRSNAGLAAKGRESSKAPEMDMQRAKQLTAMSEDDLTLLALPALRDLQREMGQMTQQASALLTHYLQLRDSHAADAEMYNGLIRDLVSGAAKRVGGAASGATGGSIRRAGTPRAASRLATASSGRNSPASLNSPRP